MIITTTRKDNFIFYVPRSCNIISIVPNEFNIKSFPHPIAAGKKHIETTNRDVTVAKIEISIDITVYDFYSQMMAMKEMMVLHMNEFREFKKEVEFYREKLKESEDYIEKMIGTGNGNDSDF